jgi:hypothetical protein
MASRKKLFQILQELTIFIPTKCSNKKNQIPANFRIGKAQTPCHNHIILLLGGVFNDFNWRED